MVFLLTFVSSGGNKIQRINTIVQKKTKRHNVRTLNPLENLRISKILESNSSSSPEPRMQTNYTSEDSITGITAGNNPNVCHSFHQ